MRSLSKCRHQIPSFLSLCRSTSSTSLKLEPKPVIIPPQPPKPIFTPPKTPRHPEITIPKELLPPNSHKANQFRFRALQLLEKENPLKKQEPSITVTHPLDPLLRRSPEVASLIDLPGRDKFVIIDVNTHQYKVMKDDLIMVNKLKNADVGDKITFKKKNSFIGYFKSNYYWSTLS